jgi:hypothetical protein
VGGGIEEHADSAHGCRRLWGQIISWRGWLSLRWHLAADLEFLGLDVVDGDVEVPLICLDGSILRRQICLDGGDHIAEFSEAGGVVVNLADQVSQDDGNVVQRGGVFLRGHWRVTKLAG